MGIEVVAERSAGLDIAKASLVACVRIPGAKGGARMVRRKFTTMTADLLVLADWLAEHQVTRVGMESTSDYWKPIFYVLEGRFECWLLNARHMRAVPGRKTDMTDAEWICDLVAHGLVRPSFVPPPPMRRLRDLTRRRTLLLAERTREKQRLEKILEDAGVKLSVVAADITGRSGRMMIEALIGDERDPHVIADLALGTMRRKLGTLAEALVGRFTDHHAFYCRQILDHLDFINKMITDLGVRIDAEAAVYEPQITLLDTVPGVDRRVAQAILAEIGPDMHRFASAAHLASWAGVCPGNNKTAGKVKPTHTRPGNRWLKAALGIAATSAVRTKNTYASAQYRRIAARRGAKRALVAVAHSHLVGMWHILAAGNTYHDLGADYYLNLINPDHQRRRLIERLEQLGFHVTVEPRPAPA